MFASLQLVWNDIDQDNSYQQRSLPWGVCCAEPSMSRNALLSLFHLWVQQLQDFHHCILMTFLMKVHTRQIHWRNMEFTGTLCDQHNYRSFYSSTQFRILLTTQPENAKWHQSLLLAADIPSSLGRESPFWWFAFKKRALRSCPAWCCGNE